MTATNTTCGPGRDPAHGTALRNSRSLRKFLRHRTAVASLLVIAIYMATAFLLLLTGWISLDDTTERVGPKLLPGFGIHPTPTGRLENAEWLIDRISSLTERRNAEAALREFNDLGDRRVADVPISELQQRIDHCWSLFDGLTEIEDPDAVLAGTERADGTPSAMSSQQLQASLLELEQAVEGLLQPLTPAEQRSRNLQLLLGTDRQGRSVFYRGIYSIRVAILVGLITGLLSVTFGTMAGLLAGFFGGWVDHVVTWLYSTFASIPNIVLLILLAFMFEGGHVDRILNGLTGGLLSKLTNRRLDETLIPVYIALAATFWIGPCRVIRGEVLKLRELEYVQAAVVMGFGRTRILLRHILPNVSHLMLINFSLLFIGAIKTEVILSFLNLGVREGPSWGIMISQSAPEVVSGFFWQIGTATVLMFCLVLAFNILSDALQDILDPKHV